MENFANKLFRFAKKRCDLPFWGTAFRFLSALALDQIKLIKEINCMVDHGIECVTSSEIFEMMSEMMSEMFGVLINAQR